MIPLAHIGKRLFCALLDFILVSALSTLLVYKVILPSLYPQAIPELFAMSENLLENFPNFTPPTLSPEAEKGFFISQFVFIFSIWIYFVLSEGLTRGSSLGKSVFGLRVISMRGTAPNGTELAIRATIKAICFMPLVLLLLNVIVMLLNRQRRAAHDVLANTLVVESHAAPIKPR